MLEALHQAAKNEAGERLEFHMFHKMFQHWRYKDLQILLAVDPNVPKLH